MISSNRPGVEYGTDVVTPEDEPVREPVDPVFASLFRPEEPAQAAVQAEIMAPQLEESEFAATHTAEEPAVALDAEIEIDPEPKLASEPRPVPVPPAASAVDTGRLFRSQGVAGNDIAVLALTSDHGGKLISLVREEIDPSLPVQANSAAMVTGAALVDDDAALPDDEPVRQSRSERRRQNAPREISHRSPGIAAGAVYLIVIAVTFIVALVNAWLGTGELGWPTGVALLVSSGYCAWRVRREDDVVAILIPPVAFFIATVIPGQMFRGASGGGLINRAQVVFFTFAYNWYWVLGTTVVAAVLVLIRRRRS